MDENKIKQEQLKCWIIWGSMFSALFFYQFFLADGIPQGKDNGKPNQVFVWISLGFVLISSGIRWFIIPKEKEIAKILVLMIVGIALGEGAQLFQLFIIGKNYPETQLFIFFLSILCVAQFIPFYVLKKPTEKESY